MDVRRSDFHGTFIGLFVRGKTVFVRLISEKVAAPHVLSNEEQTRNLEDGVPMAVVKYQGRFPVVTKAEAIRYGMDVTREF